MKNQKWNRVPYTFFCETLKNKNHLEKRVKSIFSFLTGKEDFYVKEKHRNKGIGNMLFEKVVEIAKDKKVKIWKDIGIFGSH